MVGIYRKLTPGVMSARPHGDASEFPHTLDGSLDEKMNLGLEVRERVSRRCGRHTHPSHHLDGL